jgi:hypothetical protein
MARLCTHFKAKVALADFWISPPLIADQFFSKNGGEHGRISNPSHNGIGIKGNVKTSQMPWVIF